MIVIDMIVLIMIIFVLLYDLFIVAEMNFRIGAERSIASSDAMGRKDSLYPCH
jgi:ABC-type transport system involved in Fe-S cluster assembly fused permease/ATPase subunit